MDMPLQKVAQGADSCPLTDTERLQIFYPGDEK